MNTIPPYASLTIQINVFFKFREPWLCTSVSQCLYSTVSIIPDWLLADISVLYYFHCTNVQSLLKCVEYFVVFGAVLKLHHTYWSSLKTLYYWRVVAVLSRFSLGVKTNKFGCQKFGLKKGVIEKNVGLKKNLWKKYWSKKFL